MVDTGLHCVCASELISQKLFTLVLHLQQQDMKLTTILYLTGGLILFGKCQSLLKAAISQLTGNNKEKLYQQLNFTSIFKS